MAPPQSPSRGFLTVCKSKVENAVITDASLHYHGSLTVDEEILEAAGIVPNEKVLAVNLNNGERFETYVIPGRKGSGQICLNGGTARLGQVGDKIGFLAFMTVEEHTARRIKPIIVTLSPGNKLAAKTRIRKRRTSR